MFLTSKLSNAKGFTLVELLVSVAIAGGGALLVAKLLSDQQFNQAKLKLDIEIDKQQAQIQSFLKKPEICNQTFAGVTLPLTSTGSVNVTGGIRNPTTVVLPIPSISNASWSGTGKQDYRVQALRLQNPQTNSGSASVLESVKDSVKEVVVVYELKRPYFSSVLVERKFNMFMTMDPVGLFRECGSVLGDSNRETLMKMCRALGSDNAEWIEFANYATSLYPQYISSFPGGLAGIQAAYPDGKCQLLDRRCDESQNLVAMKVDSLGGWVCQQVSHRLDGLGNKVDTSLKNCSGKTSFQINVDPVTGQLRIDCS